MDFEKFWKNKENIKRFKIAPEIKKSESEIIKDLEELFTKIIKRTQKDRKIGVLFSGGIDSTFISFLLKKFNYKFTCYTVILDDPEMQPARDLISAKKVAKELKFKHKIIKVKIQQVHDLIQRITNIIENPDVVKVGVALAIYPALKQAKKDKMDIIFSGLGSEEIFAGYERHTKNKNINKECLNGLFQLYERDIKRDIALTKDAKIKISTPFLDQELIKYSLRIPAKYKLNEKQNKIILRKLANNLGISKEITERKKLAAQYGSKMDKAIKKLAKKEKLSKSDYIKKFISTKSKI